MMCVSCVCVHCVVLCRPPGGGSHGDGGPSGPHISSKVFKTAQQLAGEAMLTRLLKEVDGVSFSFRYKVSSHYTKKASCVQCRIRI